MRSKLVSWSSTSDLRDSIDAVREVVDSDQWAYGPVARQVERALAHRIGGPGCVLTSSGTQALWAVMQHLFDTGKRRVILPNFGYIAAANIAASIGFELLICDVEPDSPVIDAVSVGRMLNHNADCLIGINYFGWSADWDKLRTISNIAIVEDAAGSWGARYDGRAAGRHGDFAIFSFHVSKAVRALGEGGAVIAPDDAVERIRSICKHGAVAGYYEFNRIGTNCLMSDASAAVLYRSLERDSNQAELRADVVAALEYSLSTRSNPVAFNVTAGSRRQNYLAYTILADDRDSVLQRLALNGVEARPCWPRLITDHKHLHSSIRNVDGQTPNARRFANLVINLPVRPDMNAADVHHVTDALYRAESNSE